ncbi:N-acetyltransferase family protein [Polaromonas sp. YR568]|uniref:GNAT family N-acetyltransferase n=1 Tax=Polaromonas sp. YR568 TaxID=1855301 RepID=UPI00398BCAE3
MKPELNTRQLMPSDADEFSALRRRVTEHNPVPMGLSLAEELTRPLQGFRDQLAAPAPSAAFGVFVDGLLRACSAVAWTSRFPSSMHKVTLWGTFVDPSHRGQGFGRMAVEAALEHARSQDVHRVNLTVFLPNTAAIGLYQSLGFEPYGLEPEAIRLDGTFYDGQHMSLLLRSN